MVQVPIVPGVPSWDNIQMPLSLKRHHVVWATAQAEMDLGSSASGPVDTLCNLHQSRGLDDPDASSDDSEDGELEEFFEPQEAGLIAAIDQVNTE